MLQQSIWTLRQDSENHQLGNWLGIFPTEWSSLGHWQTATGGTTTGKSGVGSQRFKKGWCAYATTAKTHPWIPWQGHLNQDRQYLAHKAQHPNHWAMTANLRHHYLKHSSCGLCSWKESCNPRNMLECVEAACQLWCCSESSNEDMTSSYQWGHSS